MALTRPQIDELLKTLDGKLDALRAEYPDDDAFVAAFAGEADVLDENVSAADTEYLQTSLDALLRKHRIAVPENEVPTDGWPVSHERRRDA